MLKYKILNIVQLDFVLNFLLTFAEIDFQIKLLFLIYLKKYLKCTLKKIILKRTGFRLVNVSFIYLFLYFLQENISQNTIVNIV